MKIRACRVGAVVLLAGRCFGQADSFHIMQIEQVIGGVNGDTTKQAIQLRMRTIGQNQMQFSWIKAWDATGANPVLLIAFPNPVPNFQEGDRILVTTTAFDASTAPACVPDFHMTNPIPASYMAAGRITFEDIFGTILWSVAWGGPAYTGPTTGSLTNSPTGEFGKWLTACPTSTTQALLFQFGATAAAGLNQDDYALTAGAATFTSNLHASFTVSGGAAPCYANCDNSTTNPILNVQDFACFLNKFASGDTTANCDNSTTNPILNVQDFSCFLNKFAAGCS